MGGASQGQRRRRFGEQGGDSPCGGGWGSLALRGEGDPPVPAVAPPSRGGWSPSRGLTAALPLIGPRPVPVSGRDDAGGHGSPSHGSRAGRRASGAWCLPPPRGTALHRGSPHGPCHLPRGCRAQLCVTPASMSPKPPCCCAGEGVPWLPGAGWLLPMCRAALGLSSPGWFAWSPSLLGSAGAGVTRGLSPCRDRQRWHWQPAPRPAGCQRPGEGTFVPWTSSRAAAPCSVGAGASQAGSVPEGCVVATAGSPGDQHRGCHRWGSHPARRGWPHSASSCRGLSCLGKEHFQHCLGQTWSPRAGGAVPRSRGAGRALAQLPTGSGLPWLVHGQASGRRGGWCSDGAVGVWGGPSAGL